MTEYPKIPKIAVRQAKIKAFRISNSNLIFSFLLIYNYSFNSIIQIPYKVA